MPRKRRNKILILSAAYPPSPGGVATHVANLAHGLQRDGNFDISVLYSTEHSEHPYPNKKVSNRVVALPIKSKQVASFHGRRVPCQDVIEEALRHMNDGGSVKLVHVHDFDSLHVGWIIKMVFSVKLVLSLHRAPIPWHDKHYIENAKTCYLEAMRRHDIIDAITVPSKASRNVLLKQGFDENKVHVIPHGINKKYMASFDNDINLLSDASIGDEKILIFCPIRDDMHKDYHTFINATKYIKEKCTDEPIVFQITDDSENIKISARAAGIIPGEDIICRAVAWKQIATLYRRASVCVVPSRRESFGQAVLEAFVYKTPVVAANTTGLSEIVRHRDNGLLFTDGNVEELANRVQELLISESLRRKCIDAGLEDLRKFYSSETMAENYRSLYYKLL